jgi:hypothetical protein
LAQLPRPGESVSDNHFSSGSAIDDVIERMITIVQAAAAPSSD